jgi:hypothetical protein
LAEIHRPIEIDGIVKYAGVWIAHQTNPSHQQWPSAPETMSMVLHFNLRVIYDGRVISLMRPLLALRVSLAGCLRIRPIITSVFLKPINRG